MKKKPWVLTSLGLVLVIMLVALPTLAQKEPSAPAPASEPAHQAADDLREQIKNALSSLREAQLHKDIDLYMSGYTHTFPELNKSTNTLKFWEHHDIIKFDFIIHKIQSIDANNAIVMVTWGVVTRDQRTQELVSSKNTYQVRFIKEGGKWLIQSSEDVK